MQEERIVKYIYAINAANYELSVVYVQYVHAVIHVPKGLGREPMGIGHVIRTI